MRIYVQEVVSSGLYSVHNSSFLLLVFLVCRGRNYASGFL